MRFESPAVILAGGRSSRMGVPHKGLLQLGQKSVIEHVIAALAPQASGILINSNVDTSVFAHLGLPIRRDAVPGLIGPLAGILTAMLWGKEQGKEYVLTVPVDTPFLPYDLLAWLNPARPYRHLVTLSRGGRLHPTIGLWSTALASRLAADLKLGVRSVQDWLRVVGAVEVGYPDRGADPFFNINTREDLGRAISRVG